MPRGFAGVKSRTWCAGHALCNPHGAVRTQPVAEAVVGSGRDGTQVRLAEAAGRGRAVALFVLGASRFWFWFSLSVCSEKSERSARQRAEQRRWCTSARETGGGDRTR